MATIAGDGVPRIALASCTEYAEGHGGEKLLPDLLARRGADASWAVWDDPAVEWGAFDVVVLRCTWDYPDHLEPFRAWVETVGARTEVVNSPLLVLENLHKRYLPALGADAVPTVVVPAGTTVDLAGLGWQSVVVKPAVGVGGNGAVRHASQADLDALTLAPTGAVDAVVQPYLASVERDGEVSIVCVDGEATHAVRKTPAPGEFRIHEHRGGAAARVPLDPRHAEIARRVLAALPVAPVIARVDLLHDGDRPLVCELELTEPYLWLELAPEAAARLADTLVARAAARARARA